MPGYVLIAAPAPDDVLTLAAVKQYLGVSDAAWDGRLEPLRKAAVLSAERYLGRSLSVQTWALSLDAFADEIELGHGPVTVVSSVKYRDTAGAEQTLSASVYTLDLVSDPQRVLLADGESWPEVLDAVNAVTVTFTAGYTVAIDDIRLALLLAVQAWFENGPDGKLPESSRQLLAPHRRVTI